jgi:hypothetical protein
MKMPRFFILVAVCAMMSTFLLQSIEATVYPSSAEQLPILRADPRAGDPEEPGFANSLPAEEVGTFSRISVPYETSVRATTVQTARSAWWDRLRDLLNNLLGTRR